MARDRGRGCLGGGRYLFPIAVTIKSGASSDLHAEHFLGEHDRHPFLTLVLAATSTSSRFCFRSFECVRRLFTFFVEFVWVHTFCGGSSERLQFLCGIVTVSVLMVTCPTPPFGGSPFTCAA